MMYDVSVYMYIFAFYCCFCRVHGKEDIINQYDDERVLFRDRNERLKHEVIIMTNLTRLNISLKAGRSAEHLQQQSERKLKLTLNAE